MEEQEIEIRAGNIPCSSDIEKAVLEILLHDPKVYLNCSHIELDYFYQPLHRTIFAAFIEHIDLGQQFDINVLAYNINVSLNDFKSTTDNSNLLSNYIDILSSLNAKRKILALSQSLEAQIEESTDTDLILSNAIDEFTLLLNKKKAKGLSLFSESIVSTVKEIDNIYQGKGITLCTKWEEFDRIGAIPRKNNIFVLAADKASGKTNFIIALEQRFLENNKDIAILHITMEEPKEKIIRRMVSSKTGLSERQILGVNYEHSFDDYKNLQKALEDIRDYSYDLTFIEKKLSMTQLKMYVRKFNNNAIERGKDPIIIVDNLGLIDDDRFKEDVARENNIAGEFVRLRDETKASFIVIHHLNKSQTNKFQITDGYRPREEFVRGSTRIIDYANQVALINYPKKYSELVEIYKRRIFTYPEEIDMMPLEDIFELLWEINPNVSSASIDFNASKIVDLKAATLNMLRNVNMNRATTRNGNIVNAAFVYKQYVKYIISHYAKEETKFESQRKDPISIYTFLEKRWTEKNIEITKNPRDTYLFGEHYKSPQENLDLLLSLFIIEYTKNRNNDSDDSIIRFVADMNSNIFKELI